MRLKTKLHHERSTLALATMLAASSMACGKKGGGGSAAPGPDAAAVATPDPSPAASGGAVGVTTVDGAVVTAANAALAMPGSLALIQTTGSGTQLALTASPGGDYAADLQNINVQDSTLNTLGTVNMIMCFISETKFWDDRVVNKGTYLAQIDMTNCGSNNNSGDSSSSGTQKQIINFTVNSTRAANAPLMADVWFTMPTGGNGENSNIAIKAVVAEGPSAQNPVGIFRLEFILNPASGSGKPETGYLESKRASVGGDVLLDFVDENPNADQFSDDRLAVDMQIDATTQKVTGGWLNENIDETGNDGNGGTQTNKSTYKIAYGKGKYLATDTTSSQSVCKDTNNYSLNVYQYGLYDSTTGNRTVLANPTFPIKIKKTNGSYDHGQASYYGIWVPQDVTLANGLKVYSDNAAATPYTVVTGPGLLMKHSVSSFSSIDALDAIPLQLCDMSGCNSIIAWSKSQQTFQKIGTQSNGNNGPTVTPITPTAYALNANQSYNLYSQQLNGNVTVVTDGSGVPVSATGDSSVSATATVADGLTLHCWTQCLAGGITDTNNPYVSGTNTNFGGSGSAPALGSPINYVWDKASFTLKQGGVAAALASGTTFPQNSNGLSSGAMVDDATWQTMQTNGAGTYAAGSQTTYYTWSIGGNSWNQFQGLAKVDGSLVSFSPPLQLSYSASTANGALNPAHPGQAYNLCWDGSGNLCIPGTQQSNNNYVPDFTIADGTVIGGKYIVKGLSGQKYMNSLSASACTGLNTSNVPALPSTSAFSEANANTASPPDVSALVPLFVAGAYVGG